MSRSTVKVRGGFLNIEKMSAFVQKQIEQKVKKTSPGVKAAQGSKKQKPSIVESNPAEERLLYLVKKVFIKQLVQTEKMVVEGRKFRSDIVVFFSEIDKTSLNGLCVEIDGYRHHGLSKSGFKRDREKDRLTLLSGYVTMRFFASEILDTKNENNIIEALETFKNTYLKTAP